MNSSKTLVIFLIFIVFINLLRAADDKPQNATDHQIHGLKMTKAELGCHGWYFNFRV